MQIDINSRKQLNKPENYAAFYSLLNRLPTSDRDALKEEPLDFYSPENSMETSAHFQSSLNYLYNRVRYQVCEMTKNLTQEELGNLIGVQRAQISRIENGKNLTFSTIARVFKAMGISAKLEIGSMGKVALW